MRIRLRELSAALFVAAAGVMSGCKGGQTSGYTPPRTGGSADRGRAVIVAYRCGKCHTIPGIRGAKGVFGPPLTALSRRSYIAGNFPNTPDNLVRWIMSPPTMKPGTAMPQLGLSEQQARDVAAYMYTLR